MNTSAINAFLLICAGLFPIVNPVGGAPIFLALTRHSTDREREAIARRVAVNSLVLLLGSLFVGSYVLEFFGITLPIVRVAGGLVVSSVAWRMLQSGDAVDSSTPTGTGPGRLALRDAFFPLTMPLTVGPGSISVAVTLGSQRPNATAGDLANAVLVAGAAVVGIAVIAASVYVCYRYAERIVSSLGDSGAEVVIRLSAFILLCIGISIIWSGYSGLAAGALPAA